MKSKKQFNSLSSYNDYLSFLENKKHELKIKDIDYYLKQYSFLVNMINSLPVVVYLLNYQTKKYLFLSGAFKQIYGHPMEEFRDHGLAFILAKLHPDDLSVFSTDVFKKFMEYSHSASFIEIKKTRFSLSYRVKRADGNYIKILQQYVILERDKKRNPILTLGTTSDITAHKIDNRIIFSISKYDEEQGYDLTIFTNAYSTINLSITKRENEIVKHITEGLTSKEIANKLNVSLYTVKAHRRNLLEKTKCKNIAELSSYALINGLV